MKSNTSWDSSEWGWLSAGQIGPLLLLGCHPAPDWVINRFILLNPALQGHGLLTDGLRVCWAAWRKLASACITVKFKFPSVAWDSSVMPSSGGLVTRLKYGDDEDVREDTYRVNSWSTVTQLVRVRVMIDMWSMFYCWLSVQSVLTCMSCFSKSLTFMVCCWFPVFLWQWQKKY